MKVRTYKFDGMIPRLEPRLLGSTNAQVAENVDLLTGIISPIKEPGNVATLSGSSRKTVFPYNEGWLEWDNDVDVCRSPIIDDQYNRIYYTGDGGVPKVRGVRVRADSTAYTLGQKARWETGDTVWEVTSAGTSAATAPSITGKVVGDSVTDGTVTWQMTSLTFSGADELEYDLGIPRPSNTLTLTAQAKSTVTWTREWYYQYEEPDSTVSQSGSLTEGAYAGTNVNEVTPGKSYRIHTLPTKTTASADASFVLYCKCSDASGNLLGYLYPSPSDYRLNSDFYLDGAKAEGALTVNVASPQAELIISYTTSRAEDYEVDRVYIQTFVSAWGEEGPPSAASSTVTVDPCQDCVVASLDTSVTGNYNITEVRIYRTITSDAGTFYCYVSEVDIGTATYTDSLTDAECGEQIPSTNWTAPDDDLSGLVTMPGGFLAGFVDKTVYFSEPNYPHAWYTGYGLIVPYEIVGLGVNSDGLVVLTKGPPSLMVGYHPDAMTVQDVVLPQSCVSKRSIAHAGDLNDAAVLYASPDGLCAVYGAYGRRLTKDIYTRAQWSNLNPDTMIGAVHDGKYFGITSSDSIIISFEEQASMLRTTDETATGLYADIENDLLYLIQGTELNTWRTGTTTKTATWQGRDLIFSRRGSFSVCRVNAAAYPVTLKIYAEGSLVLSLVLTENKARRIPLLRDEKRWSVAVETEYDVYEILLSTSMKEL